MFVQRLLKKRGFTIIGAILGLNFDEKASTYALKPPMIEGDSIRFSVVAEDSAIEQLISLAFS